MLPTVSCHGDQSAPLFALISTNMIDLTYESALKELQEIVDALQNNSLGIDELSTQLNRAAELIRYCREKLHKTDEEIKSLFPE